MEKGRWGFKRRELGVLLEPRFKGKLKGNLTVKTNESSDEEVRVVGLDLSRFKGKESGGCNDPASGRIRDQGVVKVIAADLVTSHRLGQAEIFYRLRTRKRSEVRFLRFGNDDGTSKQVRCWEASAARNDP